MFEERGVVKAKSSPLAIRLLWVCGCVANIAKSKLKWNVRAYLARESFHHRISSSPTECTQETLPKMGSAPTFVTLSTHPTSQAVTLGV